MKTNNNYVPSPGFFLFLDAITPFPFKSSALLNVTTTEITQREIVETHHATFKKLTYLFSLKCKNNNNIDYYHCY